MENKSTKQVLPKVILSGLVNLGGTDEAGGLSFDWGALVPYVLHPLKVEIIEAIGWVGKPLSAIELTRMLGYDKGQVAVMSYHFKVLVEMGVFELTHTRQRRGARETFYFFSGVEWPAT
jgi:hypothetical protein